MSSSSSRFAVFGGIAAAAVVGYCVYFDYNRRSSPEFRRKLKRDAKKYKKLQVEKEETSKKAKFLSIKDKLDESLKSDPLPTELDDKQNYFLQQVALGEQLASTPGGEEDAAVSFYKALAIYPQPAELLTIFQKSVPEKIYELIVFLIAVNPPASLENILGQDFSNVDANIKVVNPDEVQ